MKLPKHHYIPVFYLREWAKTDGRLTEFSRPKGGAAKARPTGPKGTGYLRGLYRLNYLPGDAAEIFERMFFRQVDSRAKDAFDILHGRRTWSWNPDNRTAWSNFVVGMMFRNPERINATKRYIEEFSVADIESNMARYEAQRKEGDPDFAEYLVRFVAFSAINWTQSMIANSKINQHLNNMRWSVRNVADAGLKLFTSDRPIIMSNGMAYEDSHIVMPISPHKAFIACNNASTESTILSMKSIEFIKACNVKILRYAQQYAWNTEDEQLNLAEKHLSAEADISRHFFDAPPNRQKASTEERSSQLMAARSLP